MRLSIAALMVERCTLEVVPVGKQSHSNIGLVWTNAAA